MVFTIDKFVEVASQCFGVQSQIAITTQKMIEKCYFDYLNIEVFIKVGFMLQATSLIICHPESSYVRPF